MTEDKKNTEETQEKEEFEVVMPEANRVEMPATEFKEQPDYLKTFANFYIQNLTKAILKLWMFMMVIMMLSKLIHT